MDNNNKSVRMRYTAELVRAQLENRIPAAIPEKMSYEEVKKIADTAQMRYMLLGSLIKLPLLEEQLEEMRSVLRVSILKTLLQVQSATMLEEKFEQAGIRNQLLKGSVMKHIYPRPELREMSDVDIMLYEDDFTQAEEIIKDCGFEMLEAIKHHVIFKKAPFLILEMHWDLYEKTVDKEQYMYYKNQFRAQLKEGKKYTYEFSKENFYVYMISHMAKHFYENGCGIRNLVDVYIYQQKYGNEMDRAVVEQELSTCGILDFEKHVAKLARIWLDDKESTPFYNSLFEYMVDCGIYGKGENGIWGQLCKQNKPDINNGKKSDLSYYFPSAEYMKEFYPWLEGKKALLPAAWLCRGVRGITHKDSVERAKALKDKKKYDTMMNIYQEMNLKFVK